MTTLRLLDMPLHRRNYLVVGLLSAGFAVFDDEGFGDLAFAVAGYADDNAVRHEGVGEEVGFEFGGGDLETFDFD